MGFLDSLKKTLGGDKGATDAVKGPSMTLRDAGIDPAGLKFDIRADGTLGVSGTVANPALRTRIGELLADIPQVKSVDNQLAIGETAPPGAAPVVPPTTTATAQVPAIPAAAEPPPAAAETYTVQSGDSLWKIAQHVYGNGAKYTAIFEANRDLLDNPDKIRPGQVLKLPALEK
jgi:nucleoid-associated protein YgaU